jgi:hypothetical protein
VEGEADDAVDAAAADAAPADARKEGGENEVGGEVSKCIVTARRRRFVGGS